MVKQFEYAGFWKRFAAVLIDAVVLVIVQYALEFILGIREETLEDIFRGIMLGLVVGVLYHALMESSKKQATLGKMCLNIQVVDYDGGRISFLRGVGRYFAKSVSVLILLIGFFMAAFTQKKQALHDMMASTLVINKPR